MKTNTSGALTTHRTTLDRRYVRTEKKWIHELRDYKNADKLEKLRAILDTSDKESGITVAEILGAVGCRQPYHYSNPHYKFFLDQLNYYYAYGYTRMLPQKLHGKVSKNV